MIQQCLHCFCMVRSHVIHNEDGIAAQIRQQVILKVRLERLGSRSSWKSSVMQCSVHLNWWQDGRIFWLGKRYRINRSATAKRIGISSGHICITTAFVQKYKITYFESRYTVWPTFPFFDYIGDGPARWHEEISSYDDIPAFEENARQYRCLPEDSMFL